jgi:hypothetical protein
MRFVSAVWASNSEHAEDYEQHTAQVPTQKHSAMILS